MIYMLGSIGLTVHLCSKTGSKCLIGGPQRGAAQHVINHKGFSETCASEARIT